MNDTTSQEADVCWSIKGKKCKKKTAVYTNVNGDIVSYTSKTAKIKR